MDFNKFFAELLLQLTRIADAASGAASTGTVDKNVASKTTTTTAGKKTTGTAKKTTIERAVVEKALLAVKDHPAGGKDAAVALYKEHGFNKMAEIDEDKFEVILKAAEDKLAELEAESEEDL